MEDIEMDNRQSMMRVREIDLFELFMTILLHWRSMIVALLCGAIALGGMSYIKSSQNVQRQQAQLQREEQYLEELNSKSDAERREFFVEKLSDEEIANVENAALYEQQYNNKLNYLESSEFMQADPLHMHTADLIYQVTTADMEQSYSIRDVYANLLRSGEVKKLMATVSNNKIDSVLSVVESSSVDLHNSNILRVRIEYTEEDMCSTLAEAVADYITNKQSEITSVVGEHEIILIGESYAEIADTSLLDSQKSLKSDLINLRTAEMKLTNDFSADQQEYFTLICMQEQKAVEDTQEPVQNITAAAPGVSKKYMLMGAILFVFIYAGILCLKCVANNKLSAKDDLQDLFGIPQLGVITKDQKKKKVFSFVDEWILKLYYHNRRRFDRAEAVELATVAIHMAAEKNELNTVYLVGTGMDQSTRQFCDTVQKELKSAGIEAVVAENILYNAESLKKLETAQGAVLVETVGKTMYTEILQELQLLDRQQIKVLGGITVEE